MALNYQNWNFKKKTVTVVQKLKIFKNLNFKKKKLGFVQKNFLCKKH